MTFRIVSVGWKCDQWWEQTLASVEAQSIDDWSVHIVYDGGDEAGPEIQKWCDERDERWHCILNGTQQFAVRNQVEAIMRAAPDDDDVVVFLDLDGDRLAHPDVLAHLAQQYADDTLVTYGSYRPVPMVASCSPAVHFPYYVVKSNSYRQHMLTGGGCCFNHLRTMKGRVAKAIPADQFFWPSGPLAGQWYEGGTDYVFMVAALELAGGRYKCLPEVLLLYNHGNPNADNLTHPAESTACVLNYLSRQALSPLS